MSSQQNFLPFLSPAEQDVDKHENVFPPLSPDVSAGGEAILASVVEPSSRLATVSAPASVSRGSLLSSGLESVQIESLPPSCQGWPFVEEAGALLQVLVSSDGQDSVKSAGALSEHLCLVDASGFLHRAWHKARDVETPHGPAGMLRLFCSMSSKILSRMSEGRHPPTRVVWVWDPPREMSWRRSHCSSYKAHREDKPDSFVTQQGWIERVVTESGQNQIKDETFEADDVIASLALHAWSLGQRVTVISSDKDLCQIVRPGLVQMDPARDVWWTVAAVEERYGVSPSCLRDWLTLAGDTADGIPGVRGVGKVLATRVLQQHGSLQAVLSDPLAVRPASLSAKILASREDLMLARTLVSLRLHEGKAKAWHAGLRAFDSARSLETLRHWGRFGPVL